jgi:hypothetical protein
LQFSTPRTFATPTVQRVGTWVSSKTQNFTHLASIPPVTVTLFLQLGCILVKQWSSCMNSEHGQCMGQLQTHTNTTVCGENAKRDNQVSSETYRGLICWHTILASGDSCLVTRTRSSSHLGKAHIPKSGQLMSVWMCSMLPTFWTFMLPQFSGLNCMGWLSLCIYRFMLWNTHWWGEGLVGAADWHIRTKFHGFNPPQANYIDRATAACRQS